MLCFLQIYKLKMHFNHKSYCLKKSKHFLPESIFWNISFSKAMVSYTPHDFITLKKCWTMNSFVKIFQVTFLAPGNNNFMGLIKKKLSNRMNCNFSSFFIVPTNIFDWRRDLNVTLLLQKKTMILVSILLNGSFNWMIASFK